jgi:hypothetical protein
LPRSNWGKRGKGAVTIQIGASVGRLPIGGRLALPAARIGHAFKRSFACDFYVCTMALEPAGYTHPCRSKRRKPPPERLIGYARVSTEEQGTDPQTDELRAAGCAAIREEHASGADRSRPVLGGFDGLSPHPIAPADTSVGLGHHPFLRRSRPTKGLSCRNRSAGTASRTQLQRVS